MALTAHPFPILEHDAAPEAVVTPDRHGSTVRLPALCLMTYFGEVLEAFVAAHSCAEVHAYRSEMRPFPVYAARYKGVDVCLVQGLVGAPGAAMLAEFLFAHGVERLVACGGCGVLQDIPAGHVLVPTSALRDEGTSYHYLPPARTVELDRHMAAAIGGTLEARGVPFTHCTVWTTDGFYRETPDTVRRRRDEGCQAVDMECAALTAVARFRNKSFGQLLYSGDTLADTDNYNDRGWKENMTARERLFTLSLEVLARMAPTP